MKSHLLYPFLHSCRTLLWSNINGLKLGRSTCSFQHSFSVLLVRKKTHLCTSQTKEIENKLAWNYKKDLHRSIYTTRRYLQPQNMASVTEENKETAAFTRLPTNAAPINYNIKIKPDLNNFTFDGTQVVEVEIKEPTKTLMLNIDDLEVKNAEWRSNNGVFKSEKLDPDLGKTLLTITFPETLSVGTGHLHLNFEGKLNDQMKGFYRSKYKTPEGKEYYNAVTQFEATDARRAFPSWDEPALKATFDITLVVPKDKVALSNMPVKNTSEHSKDALYHEVEFERTPIMSTYLLAFVIGDFEYIEKRSEDGVLCRVYTPPGKKDQGKFALDVTTKVLPYYNNYFGISYPLPKLDLVAIADFSAGAMENWGLITYRETCLLVDDQHSSATSRQWVALVVGHEIAHQWFGNLVTMEWWTHLWLNEGYATFVEFLCVDYLFPKYDIWTQFVSDVYVRALELDSLKNSHQIEVPVGNPSEINEIFDDISYSKGASIIRMLYNYIGENDFKKGMNMYLTRHAYKNAYTEDLWRALEEASNKPIGKVMSTWTKQMGFPIINVSSTQSGHNRVLQLKQEKFWADSNMQGVNEDKYNWLIPVTFSKGTDPKQILCQTLMVDKTVDVTFPDVKPEEWIKLNPSNIGYYRVRYEPAILSQFIPAITDKTLPPLDRLGLVDDLFAMVQSGRSSTVDVLKLLEAYVEEDNFTVWSSISNIVGKLNSILSYTESHEQFNAFGRHLFKSIANKVGWEAAPDESHLVTMLRSLVLLRMVSFKCKETIEETKKQFDEHVSGSKLIAADLRSAVYRGVLSCGNQETFDSMIKLYNQTDMFEEKSRIGRALGALKDKDLLKKVLEFAVSDDVRSQDSIFIVISVGMSKEGRELAWQFFKENIGLFKDRYPGGYMVGLLTKNVTENFVTEEKAQEVENFFKENPYAGTERSVQQAVEGIRLNKSWLERDSKLLSSVLAKY